MELIIIILIVFLIILFAIWISKQFKIQEKVAISLHSTDGFIKKSKYLDKKYIAFYKTLLLIMPENIAIGTKVVLSTMIEYNAHNQSKKAFLNKYVDFVIFDRDNFEPILAFDITDFDHSFEAIDVMRKDIIAVLESNGIPCICLPAKMTYNKEFLQNIILKSIPNEKLKKIGVNYDKQ